MDLDVSVRRALREKAVAYVRMVAALKVLGDRNPEYHARDYKIAGHKILLAAGLKPPLVVAYFNAMAEAMVKCGALAPANVKSILGEV